MLCAMLQVTNMFLMYSGRRRVDLDGARRSAIAAAGHSRCDRPAKARQCAAHCAAERWGVQLPPCVRLGRTVTLAVRGGRADTRPRQATVRNKLVCGATGTGHHVVTFLLLLFPLRFPAYANFTCWDGITELNTFFMIARRQWHSQRNLMHWCAAARRVQCAECARRASAACPVRRVCVLRKRRRLCEQRGADTRSLPHATKHGVLDVRDRLHRAL